MKERKSYTTVTGNVSLKKVTVNMIFGKIDRHLQRKSKEKKCESPVWQHIYFHHQAIAKKT